eukprot:jgi/Tetstr1/432323/TSEL_021721.t1
MPGDEPDPQQPADASGGKAACAGKRGRFGSRRRVEEAERRQTAAEATVAHPQNASERAAAATQRTTAENVSLHGDGDMLNKRVDKLDKNVESLQVHLDAEQCMEHCKREIKEGFRKGSSHQLGAFSSPASAQLPSALTQLVRSP